MNARNCCRTMEMELTTWKAVVYDIFRKLDSLPSRDKGNILPNIGDLHILVDEMDARIEQVRESCTPDTGMDDIQSEKDKFDHTLATVRTKAEDAMRVMGAGSFGG